MVAGIDAGNSTISISIFDQTTQLFLKETYKHKELSFDILKKSLSFVSCVILSSVVEQLTLLISNFCLDFNKKLFIVNKRVPSIIDFSLYESELGPDRVSTALGAAANYQIPVCVVDMGTATTFSLIDKNLIYQGGLIFPGVSTLFKSLKIHTDKLPESILTHQPKSLLALNTDDNIKNGIFYLVYNGISGIIKELKINNPDLKIVGTGGWSFFFKEIYDFHDENLIFKGLQNIYYYNYEKG